MVNINDQIFNFVYEVALRDATLRKAYTGSLDNLRDNKDAKNILRKYIDDIIQGRANKNLFYSTEEKIEESFAEHLLGTNSQFTFGNIQKLINMTVKYMFIICYNDNKLKENFNLCHCPMDNVMINIAIDELEKINKDNLRTDDLENLKRFLKRGNKTFLRKSWSKIESNNIEQYNLYQQIISFLAKQQGVSPIEYDYLLWNNNNNN